MRHIWLQMLVRASFIGVLTGAVPVAAASEVSFQRMPQIAGSTELKDRARLAERVVYQNRLILPYGRSALTDRLPQVVHTDRFRVFTNYGAQCPDPIYFRLFVHSARTGQWQLTTWQGDTNYSALDTYDGIRLEFDQPHFGNAVCNIILYAGLTGTPTPPDQEWGEGSLVGAIDYMGGFARNLEFNFEQPTALTGFRLQLPDFCGKLTILEAGGMTAGVFQRARLVDEVRMIFAIDSDSGASVDSLRLSINGPVGDRCSIPIFTYAVK